ncbi:MAG: plasmid stabilization protein [Bacteroidetes bacterium]|nr:plasmid stabilization protein [Bacteroidota bacterium]
MAEIIYTDSYLKRAKRFIKKHPELISQYGKTLKLLELNPNHPSLRLHKLQGKLSELYSVSINISYRISIYFLIDKDKIVPVDIGSHDDVY